MILKKLERQVGLGSVIAISIASMLGSGIFVLPGVAYNLASDSIWMAYFLAAICIVPAAVSKSELATAMPTSGGTYVYIERTFGPLAGTVSGLGLNLSLLLKSAFALVGFGAYLSVVTDLPVKPCALALLFFIVSLNILGIGKVSSLLILVVIFSLLGLLGLTSVTAIEIQNLNIDILDTLFTPGLMSATALVFVSFAGVTKVAAIAEEIKNPGKNLPRGIIYSLIIVTIVYCSTTFVLTRYLTPLELNQNLKAIHTLASKWGGETIGLIAAGLAILTMTSMANAGLLAASRFPFAMSRDKLLPGVFGKLHPKLLTPVWSILASAVIIALSIIFVDIEKIAKFASAFMILIYMTENVAVIVLRENRIQWYQPVYKAPLYPWLQIFGFLSCFALLLAMGLTVVVAILSISIPGVLLFFLFSRKYTDRRGVLGIRGQRLDLVESEEKVKARQIFDLDINSQAHAVVALFGRERSPEDLIEVGVALSNNGLVETVHLTEAPEQTVLNDLYEETSLIRALRGRVNQMSIKLGTTVVFDAIVSYDIYKSITEITSGLRCRWLVVEWGGKHKGAFTVHDPMGWLRDHLLCHLAIFKDSGVRYVKKIMVIVKSHVNNDFVLETSQHLAKVHSAEITLVSFIGRDPSENLIRTESDELKKLMNRYTEAKHFKLVKGSKRIEALASETSEYDLLIFETDPRGTLVRRIFGLEADDLMAQSACSVISLQPSKEVLKLRSAQDD